MNKLKTKTRNIEKRFNKPKYFVITLCLKQNKNNNNNNIKPSPYQRLFNSIYI
jgi:hypothetical protein